MSPQFMTTYARLFRGQIPPADTARFFEDVFTLPVDRVFLENQLKEYSKSRLLSEPTSNLIFVAALQQARKQVYDESRHPIAVETLAVLLTTILANHPYLSGYEIGVILAGSVQSSDKRFSELVDLVKTVLANTDIPEKFRHQVLQLGLLFMLRMSQLSPGAYFLRNDVFFSVAAFINDPATTRYTFEASLFLTVLCNFHRQSSTPEQNVYLKRVSEWKDRAALSKIVWASAHVLKMAAEAYSSDTDTDLGPMTNNPYLNPVNSLLSVSKSLFKMGSDMFPSAKDNFSVQPIEGAVILWSVMDLLELNSLFRKVILDEVCASDTTKPPLIYTILSFSSFAVTHATSVGTPRSFAYASLCLSMMGEIVDSQDALQAILQPAVCGIVLCRQREPLLPIAPTNRPVVWAVLDCAVLWLRHNLAKQIQVHSYSACINICYQIIFFLASENCRLDYPWKQLWDAILGLLSFITSRLDDLLTTGGVEILIRETLNLLHLCIRKCESFLPSPSTVNEFIYDLASKAEIIRKQRGILETLTSFEQQTSESLANLSSIVKFYETKIVGSKTAAQAMNAVSKLVEADGLYVGSGLQPLPPRKPDNLLAFTQTAYKDCLLLIE